VNAAIARPDYIPTAFLEKGMVYSEVQRHGKIVYERKTAA
jgi:hypothetical protein